MNDGRTSQHIATILLKLSAACRFGVLISVAHPVFFSSLPVCHSGQDDDRVLGVSG